MDAIEPRLTDYLAKIKQWTDEDVVTEETLIELNKLESMKDGFGPVYEAISKIKESITVNNPEGQE